MERVRPYLKVAAVASAVALVGAFVAYRAGAFSKPAHPESQSEPQPVAGPQTAPELPTTTTDQQHPAFMYGSKSAPAFVPVPPSPTPGAAPAPPAPNSGQPSPVFLGGSKSAEIIRFPEPGSGSQQPPAPPKP
jgi:hypothetical protein